MPATLLVELLTEELPPKSLRALSEAFKDRLISDLAKHQLVGDAEGAKVFATPRRLAVLIANVNSEAQSRRTDIAGPLATAPQQAIAGFAKKHGVAVEALGRQNGPKGEVVVAHVHIKGVKLHDVLAGLVSDALRSLPIPKVMRWGSGEAQFVRPVHGLVMMHGTREIPGSVFGLSSRGTTQGHRFLALGPIALSSADEYEERLRSDGRVIADFAKRRAEIEAQLKAAAKAENASLGAYQDLLEEVTALVEFPCVYLGRFDAGYLEVPQECLILTMRQNQKYFPLFDERGKLAAKFLIVSNMKVADPGQIVSGNERVVRPRLDDARFFFEQDRKLRLEARVPRLASVVYHGKLGSQLERVERIQLLAGGIARKLKADAMLAERAAWLAKADLLTAMVGEFPELQGTMGRYYALHDGERDEVADAIEAHYRPRFAGDRLPGAPVASAVALGDKLDQLAGLFGLGQVPTGEKDPFGLRRAALGVVRILVEQALDLSLADLIKAAFAGYAAKGIAPAEAPLQAFIYERARGYFQDRGYSVREVEAVLCLEPARLDLVPRQLEAVRAFSALPEAESLAAANKRIGNILRQAADVPSGFDPGLMSEPEEKALAADFRSLDADFEGAFRAKDYTGALKALARLKAPVDAFFDKVMVMDKDPAVRANRIGFLGRLHGTMNRIADLSKLAK